MAKKVTASAGKQKSTVNVKRPAWSDVYEGYPKVNGGTEIESDLPMTDLFTSIFGADYDTTQFNNGCATRVSLGLLSGGLKRVGERDIVISEKSHIHYGKSIEPGAARLKDFLIKIWGSADYVIKYPLSFDDVSSVLNDKKGVYIMVYKRPADHGGATGHATLWTGNRAIGGNDHADSSAFAIYFWELK
ncbi:T6SS effector amidase Tae4 family protein [Escherichia sp. E4385]|uniref:T6SS effector amidase Tae4 family protein n=1 Tax=Escherichia sp. E4385 TaxID=2040639 RepID=UPI0010FE21C5|nr:T6SS effector amidase Tae4 family protein [Escherichia sp. E4385]TLI94341.1 hypothetical protein FEK49_23795 [Escherichia sp. E4385]